MSQPTPRPPLTPQFCFSQTALRDFLRISRSTTDDSITQNLNALLTPSSTGFDPNSTASRSLTSPSASRAISPATRTHFTNTILFPAWAARSDVLDYCAGVATSPDPDDPESVLRQVEDAQARSRAVDERLDPYSGRYFPREARTESLAALMRNERAVERIVRGRSWGVLGERCEVGEAQEEAFERWRREAR